MKYAKRFFISQLLICLPLLLSVQNTADAKIVYVSDGNIYVMNDNGGSKRRITDTPWRDRSPRWSPDGKQIAFQRSLSEDTEKYELFLMNADGTTPQQLTDSGGSSGFPTWSPDGTHLAYQLRHGRSTEIYVMDLERRTIKQLTGIEKPHSPTAPDWSPDGKEIIYEKLISNFAGVLKVIFGVAGGIALKNIWGMSADGTNQRPLVPELTIEVGAVFRHTPRWSPDGQRILYHESRRALEDVATHFVILHRRNGKTTEIDIKAKIGGEWIVSGKCWMDNGRAILFSAGRPGMPEKEHHDIYRYEIATGQLTRLTHHSRQEIEPDWIEGPLPVAPQGKLSTQWGQIKRARGH